MWFFDWFRRKRTREAYQIRADAAECERFVANGSNSSNYLIANCRRRLSVWQKYAERGMPEAQWLYADCLLEGVGVAKNPVASIHWFRKAAEQGLALAQMSLGNRYYRGEGVAQDVEQAKYWYQLAAAQGQPIAQSMLTALSAVPADVTSHRPTVVPINFPLLLKYLKQSPSPLFDGDSLIRAATRRDTDARDPFVSAAGQEAPFRCSRCNVIWSAERVNDNNMRCPRCGGGVY